MEFMNFIIVATLYSCITLFPLSPSQRLVKIGAIFFHNEIDIMNAFERAIEDVNEQELNIRLEAVKHFLAEDDSVILQKFACELIEDGVSAIFGPSSKTKSDIVEIICNITGTPHIQFDWHAPETPAHRRNHRMSVNVAPSELLLSTALWEILRHNDFNWNSFTIVYESEESLARMQHLFAWKPLHKTGFKIRRFQRGQDYRILWKDISNSREKYVILDCPPDILVDVVNASIYFNMTSPFNHLFLTNLDTHLGNLTALLTKDFNAITSAIYLSDTFIKPIIQHQFDIFENAEDRKMYYLHAMLIYDAVILFFNTLRSLERRGKFRQLPHRNCHSRHFSLVEGRTILHEMKTLRPKTIKSIPGFKTQKLQLNEFGERDDFNLNIYNPMTDTITHVWNKHHSVIAYDSLIGNSTTENIDRSRAKEDIPKKRLRFTVSTRVGEPYFMYRQEPEGQHYEGNERFEGYVVDLIYKLAEKCEFDFVFEPVADNNYGSYDPVTDEWNGIIRQLIDNNAQLGICDLTITRARRRVVDFTVPFMQLGVSILHYKAPTPPPELFTFLKHFALEVWIYLLIALLIAAVLLVIAAKMSQEEWEETSSNNRNVLIVENKWNLVNTFWLLIGSTLAAGCDILPRAPSMRIFTGFWWIFALVLSQTYLAKLTSVITSSKMESPINNLHDLVDQNKVQFGTVKGGSTSLLFSESNESDFRIAWNKMSAMKPEAFTANNKEGVDRVRRSQGRYAFLMETTNLQYYKERDCDLTEIGSPFGEKHYGIAVPLNANYRSSLNVGILKLSETGVLKQLQKKWFKSNDTNCNAASDTPSNEDNKFNMESAIGLFVVLGGGIAIATIFGICEFLWNVQRVSTERRLSHRHVLRSELKFMLKFWVKRKPVNKLYLQSQDSTKAGCPSVTSKSTDTTVAAKTTNARKKRRHRKSSLK